MLQVLEKTAQWVAIGLTAVLVLVVSANVFARYLLLSGLLWAEEISRITFVWVVFLGAYVALTRGGHLAIQLVTDRLPRRLQRPVRIASAALMLLFLGVVAWNGAVLVARTVAFARVTPILGISAAWGYAAVPVAAGLMFLHVLRMLFGGSRADANR